MSSSTRVVVSWRRRPIAYPRPSEDAYLARLAAAGRPQDYLDVQRMIHRIVRLNVSALPNRAVRRLTGRPATTLARFDEDHRDVWVPERWRDALGRMRAARGIMTIYRSTVETHGKVP